MSPVVLAPAQNPPDTLGHVTPLRIALATCSQLPELDADDAPLLDALAARGADAQAVVWDDPAAIWASYDLVVVRSTWDYVGRLDEFLAWAGRVEGVSTLANPSTVLAWNTDKTYLRDLDEQGIAVIPTKFLHPAIHNEGRKIHARTPGRGEFVVKPSVSAGSMDTARYRSGDVKDRGAAMRHTRRLLTAGRGVMIQPYFSGIDEAGETGLVYLAGEYSHAARKGAILQLGEGPAEASMAEELSPREPSPAARELADAVVATLPSLVPGYDTDEPLLYTRVDLLPDEDGNPVVLEVEVTEPSLFLRLADGAVDRFADAIVARARAARSV